MAAKFVRFTRRLDAVTSADATLTQTLEQRLKSRQRVTLDDGTAAGLFLERGVALRDGDGVATDDGKLRVLVRAAPESVSTVHCENGLMLARACYHLGNRHVPLQIGAGWVRYQHDHVLDDMLRGLGLTPVHEQAPFDPEPGAYHPHGERHGHEH